MSLCEDSEIQATILDSITEGVFTVDSDWRITSFNRAAEKITGIPREREHTFCNRVQDRGLYLGISVQGHSAPAFAAKASNDGRSFYSIACSTHRLELPQ